MIRKGSIQDKNWKIRKGSLISKPKDPQKLFEAKLKRKQKEILTIVMNDPLNKGWESTGNPKEDESIEEYAKRTLYVSNKY